MHVPSLNFELGEDIDLLRESVAAFASHHIAPLAAAADHDNVFPAQLWRLFGEQGLLGLTVEEAYGGSGMGYLAHVVAMERNFACRRCDRAVLRRALQPVPQPAAQERHPRTEAALPAQAVHR